MSKLANAGPTAAAAAPAPPLPPAYGKDAMVDLEGSISWSGSEVLNAAKKDSLGNALKQGLRDQEVMLIESDADEQLLIKLAFTSKVKIHSLAVSGPSDGRAPLKVKLFVNKPNLSFADCEDMTPEQELELTEAQLGERLDLKFVKFQNVEALTFFVASNQGDEESTALSCLKFWGTSVAGTNMGEVRRAREGTRARDAAVLLPLVTHSRAAASAGCAHTRATALASFLAFSSSALLARLARASSACVRYQTSRSA